MSKAAITAIGGFLPENIVTNFDFEKILDTTDEWITTRTGIKQRHIENDPAKATSDMGVKAVEELCKKRGISPEEIDLLIVATVTPDMVFPATANLICSKIGAKNAWGFDLGAACSGFIYALATGAQFIESGCYKKVVIVGADMMSRIIDYTDRTTCVIFGDGAGAVLLEPSADDNGIQDFILHSDGNGAVHLHMKAGGSLLPPSHDTVNDRQHFVHQEGQAVFKHAVYNMAEVSAKMMEKSKLKANDITWLVPHQANKRIIEATSSRMGLSTEKVMMNIEKYGNTTAGTIPLLLWDYEKRLKPGDNLILSAFGGGFTWGAMFIKWAYDGSKSGK
ncbi:MAG: ketoacyl-ACP synthase III [Bacteroidia bacterium]|jgi:3-oxoacyl-[acyl-carrier-protein] synthase III|nr:ketoacyl-ACP synthase III [Sphingobacteriaceae bacterium]MBK7310686.1 ketoacyl-ACP synthase III [Sphingobacteriaceae bacterium]MBK7817783.1 ketoacyl-ACP synthase III [Sphingobacteriaceae bacterium]MBP9068659.1 ketoacyl-ACP synthase III [Bacteroidia bacterium]